MWDTSIVLTYLRDLKVQEISLKTLTLKLAMLRALVTGQRYQSIHLMNLEQLFMGPEFCKFVINDIVKQSGPGRTQPELVIPIFHAEPKLCVFNNANTSKELNYANTSNELNLFEVRRHVCF